jgi:hypothetical protein
MPFTLSWRLLLATQEILVQIDWPPGHCYKLLFGQAKNVRQHVLQESRR